MAESSNVKGVEEEEENCSLVSASAGVNNNNQSCSPIPDTGSWKGIGARVHGLARDPRIGMLFSGLVLSFLLLSYNTNSLTFFPNSYLNSINVGRRDALDEILKSAAMDDKKTVILTTLNEAWAAPDSLFDVLLESFRVGNGTSKLLDHLVVIAMDPKAYARCLQVHPHCFNLATEGIDFSEEAHFMTHGYLEMVWRRLRFLGVVLEKGYDFLITDADILWFRSPFPHFYEDVDFQISCDNYNSNPDDKNNSPNAGFVYVRSNNRTVQFYKFWYESRQNYPGKHEQDVLNDIKSHQFLNDIGLQMKFLDTAYMGTFCQMSRDLDRICTMHANCCVGLVNKLEDLKALLNDWKKYKTSGSGDWSAPKACINYYMELNLSEGPLIGRTSHSSMDIKVDVLHDIVEPGRKVKRQV